MMGELKEYVQPGIITILTALIGGLWWKRASNDVKSQNARNDRESRFEDNLQARYDRAMGRISELTAELDDLKHKLAEADKRLTVVQLISEGDPQRAIAFAQESGFLDFERPLRRPPASPPRPSPYDPFQAADPYAPKPPKKGK